MYLKAMQWRTLVLENNTGSAVKHRDGTINASVCSRLLNTGGTHREGRVLLKPITADEFI